MAVCFLLIVSFSVSHLDFKPNALNVSISASRLSPIIILIFPVSTSIINSGKNGLQNNGSDKL